jgi:orotate phosphoribosyltransferase
MEKALNSEKSAVQEAYQKYGVTVYPIVTMDDIIQAIRDGVIPFAEYLDAMLAYRQQYGVQK